MKTQQIVLASRPQGTPTLDNFRSEYIELREITDNEVLIEGLYYSVDPYMRGRMNDSKSYVSNYQIDQPISGGVAGKVIKSNASEFKNGDLVMGRLPWSRHAIVNANELKKLDQQSSHPSYYLGILGMPGLTAYFGLLDICKPSEGETGVISGAAGAVGLVVGQIAKLKGCKVIGIVGSDKKAELLKKEYGFDEAINYKDIPDLKESLISACPNGIDFYFDNVGGIISDNVLALINNKARIAICGQISLYNDTENPSGPRIQPILLGKSALMQGFLVNNYQHLFMEGTKDLSNWMKEGRIKYQETTVNGFEQLPNAFLGLFKGENIGKMIVTA